MRQNSISREAKAAAALIFIFLSFATALLYANSGTYGLHVLLLRGASVWVPVEQAQSRLSPSVRLALAEPNLNATPGAMSWSLAAPGLEVGELPALANGVEVDRIMLARIDPNAYRFEVLNRPSGLLLEDWMRETKASVVINGSYFAADGRPDTPLVSDGQLLGPAQYEAQHGVFIARETHTGVADLSRQPWREALAGARNAMVSYPMLIGADGESRVGADKGWLANRSFVAEDRTGRILVGTTKDAFFTLKALAAFLKQAPLDLRTALNLDGGLVACQGIDTGAIQRRMCGSMEVAGDGKEKLLLQPAFRDGKWALPIVLAVIAKQKAE